MSTYKTCYVCAGRFANPSFLRKLGERSIQLKEIAENHRHTHQPPQPIKIIDNADLICQNCLSRAEKVISDQDNDSLIEFNVLAQKSRSICFICEAHEGFIRLPFAARIKIFVEKNIFVPDGTRVCPHHLSESGDFLLPELLQGLSYVERKIYLDGKEIAKWFGALRNEIKTYENKRFQDESCFTDEDFVTFTSITKCQFNQLFSNCSSVVVYGSNRECTKKDLLLVLCKLRQGLSDAFLKVMFHYSSRQAVSLAVTVVRKSLMADFVPNNLGVGCITREDFIHRHVTEFANTLYNHTPDERKVIIYIDGTYLRVPKNSNWRVLRQSFCIHKGYHLVKPIMVVASDGYILDVHGPYYSDSKNNDAACLLNELKQNIEGFRTWLQPGDIFVVDRGYRDSLEYLESIGIDTQMPSYLRKGSKQHTIEEANNARLITKTRWIVEARNGHIKSIFKIFRDIISSHHLENIGDFFRIACAIVNAYHPLIHMEGADKALARQMLEQASVRVNTVQARVEADGLNSLGGNWLPMNQHHLPGFPILPLQYLRDLTLGVYQLGLAKSYSQDKLAKDSEYLFEVILEIPGFLRVRIHSRFRNQTQHRLYIAYTEQNYEQSIGEEPLSKPEEEPIQGWYCTCTAGARTAGCCAHIASLLWYLGYARHQANISYPSTTPLSSGSIVVAANRELPELV